MDDVTMTVDKTFSISNTSYFLQRRKSKETLTECKVLHWLTVIPNCWQGLLFASF